ncbi:hypothetical protein C2S51_021847 [Perilla frutescens var. frutescens]|nr:hypothetical protein C2S51_021847 [Perilla frutescens var. frutescens]
MRNSSQTISKTKPKIRIIHIFAPEIIKTDAANFRELVQRLTGRPTDGAATTTTKERVSRKRMRAGLIHADHEFRERVKEEEEEIWRSANSGGGFLGGFGEFDHGFLHELNHFHFLEGVNLLN